MIIGGRVAFPTNGEGGVAHKTHLCCSLVRMEDWMMADEVDRMAFSLPLCYFPFGNGRNGTSVQIIHEFSVVSIQVSSFLQLLSPILSNSHCLPFVVVEARSFADQRIGSATSPLIMI